MAFASSVFQENAVLSQQGGLSGSWGPEKDLFISEAGFWEVDLASSRGWDLPREIVPVADPGFVTAVQCHQTEGQWSTAVAGKDGVALPERCGEGSKEGSDCPLPLLYGPTLWPGDWHNHSVKCPCLFVCLF